MTVSLYQWGKVTSLLRKLTVVLVRMLTIKLEDKREIIGGVIWNLFLQLVQR